MNELSKQYHGGVLIIGSLLWQEGTTDQPWDEGRKNWRKQQLEMKDLVKVYAPVRYGRYSTMKHIPAVAWKPGQPVSRTQATLVALPAHTLPERNGVSYFDLDKQPQQGTHQPFKTGLYTMVLSMEYQRREKLGTAFVAPLRSTYANVEEIRRAAVELARAEGICKPGEDRFITSWGMISVQAADEDLQAELAVVWREELNKARKAERPISASYQKLFCMRGEDSCIDKNGLESVDN